MTSCFIPPQIASDAIEALTVEMMPLICRWQLKDVVVVVGSLGDAKSVRELGCGRHYGSSP